jgi:hypothetical protein
MRKFWLILLLLPLTASAADLTMSWSPVTTYDDGTPLPAGAIVTYNVYGGIQGQPRVLKDTTTATSETRKNIQLGVTTCYHVTAVVAGQESLPSNDLCNTPVARPAAPQNLK